ncbi:GntR family transcriptional regulator [Bradyrhizobium sp. Rc2d]|uniref:GntR family transcriptional regulator n=1 Tax=Bradyrhizobium sp. Rc2d TaxID=1855321 RepID=UPI001FCDA512|nr:GntR family transcriptional regulator [Bradyrhizobium sp. Rc2d]
MTHNSNAKLASRAYKQIEELIVTLQLPPKSLLSEQSLAEQLGMGRTPVREALQILARDGLVEIVARRGVLVSEIDLKTQLRLLEVRREIERLAARLAAVRAAPRERELFRGVATDMLDASTRADDLGFMRLDRQFNLLVLQAARNDFIVRTMSLIAGQSRRFWYHHYKEVADLPLAAKLHADVAAAIADGDVAAAGAASDRLMDYIEEFARKTIDV